MVNILQLMGLHWLVSPSSYIYGLLWFYLQTTTKKKITSVFCFPQELNMAPRLSECPKSNLVYDLAAVLIHKGSAVNSGHYTAHIREHNTGQWWEFDDEQVSNLGQQPFGSNASTSGSKTGQNGAVDCSLSAKEVEVPVNGNYVYASQMQSSESNGGANHVQTFSSTDAYMLMYVLRHSNIDCGKTTKSDEYKMEIGGPLPSHLREDVDVFNSVYLASCEQYKSKKEVELSCITKRRLEVRSILSEAPVHSIEKPYFWISTEWLRQWADNVTPS